MQNFKNILIHYPLNCRDFEDKGQELKSVVLRALNQSALNVDQLLKNIKNSSALSIAINELIKAEFIELKFTLHGPLLDEKRYFYSITQKGLVELQKWQVNGRRIS